MLAELYVLSGRDAGKAFNASVGPTVFLGRAASNHLRIRDRQASRVHCRIDITADGLILSDNESNNGTYLNGERSREPTPLQDGDEIQIGETVVKVLVESPAEREAWERAKRSGARAKPRTPRTSQPTLPPPDLDAAPIIPPERLENDGLMDSGSGFNVPLPHGAPVNDDSATVLAREAGFGDSKLTDSNLSDSGLSDSGFTESGRTIDELEPFSPAPAPRKTPRKPRSNLREVLPGYTIEARLGGHSHEGLAVYRARQASLDRQVALKVLLPKGSTRPQDVKRFLREAQAIARLPHPNIVTIHDLVQRGKLTVLVMEYIAGGSLADRLEDGKRLSLRELFELAESVGRALAYAHTHQIAHRNIKPSKILRSPQGEAWKLVDFGLATDPTGHTTGDTSFIDAPLESLGFLAPEQLAQAGEPGVRADVYSLGATLYACATGHPPFAEGTMVDLAARVLHDDPDPPQRLPEPLRDLVLQCLHKDPDQRPPDGQHLLDAIRSVRAALAREGRALADQRAKRKGKA